MKEKSNRYISPEQLNDREACCLFVFLVVAVAIIGWADYKYLQDYRAHAHHTAFEGWD